MLKFNKDDFRSFVLSFAVTTAALVLYLYPTLVGMENRALDFRFDLRGPLKPHPEISVITVDEKSIREMGRWPWPRNVHADMIRRLTSAGAKAIAFDVLFTEPDKDRPWADEELGQAAEKSGRVVFGALFQVSPEGGPTSPMMPVKALDRPGVHSGSVNIFPESDGVSRKVPLWVDYKGQKVPTLPVAALAVAQQQPWETVLSRINPPVEGDWNEINANFIGGFQTFPYFLYVDVLKGQVPDEMFRDKIVFIGGTATALFDFKAVPNVSIFPGLEIHANVLDNLLYRRYIQKVGRLWIAALVLFFGVGCGWLAARFPAWAGALSAGGIATYFFLCQLLFSRWNILLDFVWPSLAVFLSYVVVLSHRFLTENREKRWIKDTFSQYMSPKIIDVLMADPSRLKMGGEEREMTVFFSDMEGFTSLSEKLKPAALVAYLNEYLTEMSDIIFQREGVTDKYIGDAIMAFWNAPVDQADHATLACLTALDQVKKLHELQKRFIDRGLPPVDFRIGINTGRMIFGNMGSKNHSNFTVVGDAVNLAARLEPANKPFRTRVMISESTYLLAKNDIEVRQLDLVRVKGKTVPIKVFELVAEKDGLTDSQKKAFKFYQEGLGLYRYRQFQEAVMKFRKALEILPDDGPSLTYVQRCEGFLASPPPADWDGVFTLTTK